MKVLRVERVSDATGLAKSTLYKYMAAGMFPKPIHLGPRCVGWLEQEIFAWIEERAKERVA
ncbi:helix-turn-helix transcriptional regulator [Ferribacterium limneticum]|uniref:helix-turn-helix transcriptional regulator n=1 Tax=Ferribacterium limneticum TaxID=76259 RepID=UPI001CFA67F9|nr:AlpA family transcriptional regulator [Ferribacterium limneticum]UCV27074.1 AlpA family transcriptional regulator [Ferribacterium limneticum]UCV30991.1 AlpA family transcriptional regulator [Ferribacterium limneticum]